MLQRYHSSSLTRFATHDLSLGESIHDFRFNEETSAIEVAKLTRVAPRTVDIDTLYDYPVQDPDQPTFDRELEEAIIGAASICADLNEPDADEAPERIYARFYYRSASRPDVLHETTVDLEDGSALCTCEGFNGKHGHCWHAPTSQAAEDFYVFPQPRASAYSAPVWERAAYERRMAELNADLFA